MCHQLGVCHCAAVKYFDPALEESDDIDDLSPAPHVTGGKFNGGRGGASGGRGRGRGYDSPPVVQTSYSGGAPKTNPLSPLPSDIHASSFSGPQTTAYQGYPPQQVRYGGEPQSTRPRPTLSDGSHGTARWRLA